VAEKTNFKLFPSKGEARKMILGGGVSINKEKVEDPQGPVALYPTSRKVFAGSKRKEKLRNRRSPCLTKNEESSNPKISDELITFDQESNVIFLTRI
jgi:ribosomal protein S4